MLATVLPSPLRQQQRNISLLYLLLLLVSSLSSVLMGGLSSALARGPSPALSLPPPVLPAGRIQPCGIIPKNPDGTYHFSWLHVDSKTGYIMNEQGCIVDLRGFNSAGTEFGDGVSGFPALSSARLTWFNSLFKMNYIRLNLNVGWWNTNVYVPNAQMHYQAWIQQWIRWAEQNGDYVLLNRTNEYTIPPCGGSVTYCPSQAEPSDIDDANLQAQFNNGHLLDQTLAFWKSIASLYQNDPAILYDDWNEMHNIDAPSWRIVQTTLINTIRSINPRSLIMLGSNDWNNSMNAVVYGQVPDLAYPNLVYDWHIYDGKSGQVDGLTCTQGASYMWSQWGIESNKQFSFAHSHGHGAVVNEWGGCLDDPTYNNLLSSFAASNHVGMAYYWAANVVNGYWTGLNSNGLLAQAAYARFRY